MVRSQNLFREYILWRARMAAYATMILAVVMVIGLAALLISSAANVNRFGLLLQMLGVLSLVPHVIGKQRLPFFRRAEAASGPADTSDVDQLADLASLEREEEFFNYYQANNLNFVLGNILASLALVSLLVDGVFAPHGEIFPGEAIWRILFSLLGFAWLNIYMILHVFRLAGSPTPRGLLAWFFAVDLFVGVLGVIFAGIVHILLRWLAGGLAFVFNNGLRRVLLIVSLPFFFVGLFFELIATIR